MRYAWIEKHRQIYATTMMCELLSVSRSGLNAARSRAPSKRSRDDKLKLNFSHALQQALRLVQRHDQQHDEKALRLGFFNQRQLGLVRKHGFTHKRLACFKQGRPAGMDPQARLL